jgi:hypothetical protein
MEEIFFHCRKQWKRFSSTVEYKWRTISGCLTTFLPLYLTMQEFFFSHIPHSKRIFSVVSHDTEASIPLWVTTEKNDTTKNDIFKFLSASLAFR